MQSGVAYGEFQKLDAAVKAVFTAKDVNTFVANLSEARGIAEEIGGPVGTQIAEALLKAAQDGGVLNRVLGDASGSADTLATELSEGAIQVLKLNEIDMSDGLSDATKQAAELAANLNISLTLIVSNDLSCAEAGTAQLQSSWSKQLDPYRLKVEAPDLWSSYFRARFNSPREVALFCDVSFQTALNWWGR